MAFAILCVGSSLIARKPYPLCGDVVTEQARTFLPDAFIANAIEAATAMAACEQRERGKRNERVADDTVVRSAKTFHSLYVSTLTAYRIGAVELTGNASNSSNDRAVARSTMCWKRSWISALDMFLSSRLLIES